MATQGDRFKDRTLFKLSNLSDVVVRAKVNLNFSIYGDRVQSDHDEFEGNSIWILLPHQLSQGWFELTPLLAKKGKTIDQMIEERVTNNKKKTKKLRKTSSYTSICDRLPAGPPGSPAR